MRWYQWVVIGLTTMIGPFSTDSFIPNMPAMQEDLDASAIEVGLALQLNWLSKGISTLIVGSLSDSSLGRRDTILLSFLFYLVGALGCAYAKSAPVFIAMRVVEGLGESAAVACMAIVRDVVEDVTERTRMLALLGMLQPVAIVCAPVFGGILGAIIGWRNVFKGLAAVGFALTLAVLFLIPRNTKPPQDQPNDVWKDYAFVLRKIAREEPEAAGAVIVFTMGMSGIQSFLSTISLLLEEKYGIAVIPASLIIGSIPVLIITTNAFIARTMRKPPLRRADQTDDDDAPSSSSSAREVSLQKQSLEEEEETKAEKPREDEARYTPRHVILWSLGGLVVSGFVSTFFAFAPFTVLRANAGPLLFAIYLYVFVQSMSVGPSQAVFVQPFPESAGAAAAVIIFVQMIVSTGVAMAASALVQAYGVAALLCVLAFSAFGAQPARPFLRKRLRAAAVVDETTSLLNKNDAADLSAAAAAAMTSRRTTSYTM